MDMITLMSAGNYGSLADRARAHQEAREELFAELADVGPGMIDFVLMHTGASLRALAKECEVSPTYLSRVRHGTMRISPAAFAKIWNSAIELDVFHVEQSKP